MSLIRLDEVRVAISQFWKKDRKTKYGILKKQFYKVLMIMALFPMPWIIASLQTAVKEDRDQILLNHLSIQEKWQRVRNGSARVKCQDDAPEILKREGLDPSSLEGIEYAVDYGLCTFITIENYAGPKQACQQGSKWLSGDCIPSPIPLIGTD